MSTFAFLFVCVQACLLQSAYSQCAGLNAIGFNYAVAEPYTAGLGYGAGIAAPLTTPLACGPTYGGDGIGEVTVAGELPLAGATVVAGQVPILGAVEFRGLVPASGAISITGSCACGCGYDGGPYYY